jgi:hypothetical protein
MSYLYLPFIIQGILMGVDERLHQKRGLSLWEKLGHPLDSLTVFIPLTLAGLRDYSKDRLTVFIVFSVFSCLFITKDEFVHSEECSPFENWLHAVLFVLHPMIFLCTAIIWKYHPTNEFLSLQPLMVGAFMIYQILRWSIPWKTILK